MATNSNIFEGSEFRPKLFEESELTLKLTERSSASMLDFVEPLQTDKQSNLTENEAESLFSLQVDLSSEQDQTDDDVLSITPISFERASQAKRLSVYPAIEEALKESNSARAISQPERRIADFSQARARSIYSVSKIRETGNIQIDAILHNHKWRGNKITYSFFDGGFYDGTKEEKNVKEITGKMKSYLRHILEDLIEPLINIDFVEVSDKGDNFGQIRYMFSDGPDYAYASIPEEGNWWEGDVHFNPRDVRDWNEGPGSYGYETMIHETLHTLGLKHPGNYNGSGKGDPPFLPNHLDINANTVMTYNDDNVYATTLMPYDIRALQYVYGAKDHEAGNTTYKFDNVYGYTIGGKSFGSKTQSIKQSIWDSAGKDTFDFSELAFNKSGYRFDLNEGGWITTQKAYESSHFKAEGNGKRYKTTSLGTKTAFGATIENLVNSSSDDIIIANKAANIFSGYKVGKKVGNDIIIDTNSEDTLDLSSYNSSAVKQTTRGNDLIIDLGSDGSITLKDYQAASQGQRINILWSDSHPPIAPPTGNTVEVSFQQGVNNYNGAVDTYINSGSAKKHGSAQTLRVDGQTKTGHIDQTLLRFDNLVGQGSGQIDPNAQIQSATLQLNAINGGDRLQLHRMLTNWSSADTWGSLGNGIQANGQEAAANAEAISGAVDVGLLSFDVTASLKAWLANPSSNYGWAILPTGTDGVNFHSAEAEIAPKLVVKHRPSLPPATPHTVGQTLMGATGDDQLQGGVGNDLIRGGHGNDSITGLAGDDTIYGGEGIDTIVGGSGNDLISGGQLGDQLTGGAGSDTFTYRYIGHGGDAITDFDVRSDRFDVSDIFASSNYDSANVFNDYIQVLGSSEGAKVRLDLQGDTGDQFQTLATLQGVDVNSLNANHFIV